MLVLVSYMQTDIFGVGVSVGYGNRCLVLDLVSDVDIDIGCWC